MLGIARQVHFGIVTVVALVMMTAMAVGAAASGSISGVVRDAQSKPAVGAMVKAKNVDKGITTTVFTLEQGRFSVPNLPAGSYVIQSLGGGYQSESKDPVALAENQKLTVDLALTSPQNFRLASTASLDMELLPAGETKAFIQNKCGLCHRSGFQEILLSRKDRDGWMQTLEKMRNHPYGYSGSLVVTDAERDMVVDYLAKNLNPSVPPLDQKAHVPKEWVTGAAAKSIIVEYDLPKGAYPHDVAVDAQGAVWVSERELGHIGRIDPNTRAYTRYKVPGEEVELSDAIQVDAKGRPWMVDANNSTAFEFNPETKKFTAYPYKATDGERGKISANTIAFLKDGTVWFTEVGNSKVDRLDPATKEIKRFSMPTPGRMGPYGMAVDGAGIIWFPEQLGDKVGKIDPKTEKITEYDPPTPKATPRRMGVDKYGNPWFSEFSGNNLVMIDYKTSKMTEYPVPTKYAAPYGVDGDMVHGYIWVSLCHADKLARFDPQKKTWVEYPLPDHYLSVRKIAVDPKNPNRVWFGESFTDRVGYLEVIQ